MALPFLLIETTCRARDRRALGHWLAPLHPFAPLFSKRVWVHVQILLMGAILAPAQRTVAAALRVVGLGESPHFQRYHRVLNRAGALWAGWSSLAASRVLLCLLVAAFVPDGPLVVGVDETLPSGNLRYPCQSPRAILDGIEPHASSRTLEQERAGSMAMLLREADRRIR